MRTYFALALLGAVSASPIASKFMDFITKHNKSYATVEEFETRKAIFNQMDQFIESHNAKEGMTFTVGFNKFSDYTPIEYKKMLGFIPSADALPTANITSSAPASVNWVEAGAVQAVRDQGQCGSCWAFSSMGAIESAHWIASGESVDTSEQQLVDCSNLNLGCNGGNQGFAFKYFANH